MSDILGYNSDGEPQYASVKIPQYLEDIEAAKAGECYTIEDLRNDDEWKGLNQEEEDTILGYNSDGEPQYASVKIPQYLEDIGAAKAGNFYTLNDLKEWANPTKSIK